MNKKKKQMKAKLYEKYIKDPRSEFMSFKKYKWIESIDEEVDRISPDDYDMYI